MKTNKKYFEIFKKECQYWIDFFGLTDYRIEFFMSEEINGARSEEHTSELQSHSFISYAVFCLKKKN